MDEMLKSLPSQNQRKNVQTIFNRMVEARQNCEQMIFRGHRLLDQARPTHSCSMAHAYNSACNCKHLAAFLVHGVHTTAPASWPWW